MSTLFSFSPSFSISAPSLRYFLKVDTRKQRSSLIAAREGKNCGGLEYKHARKLTAPVVRVELEHARAHVVRLKARTALAVSKQEGTRHSTPVGFSMPEGSLGLGVLASDSRYTKVRRRDPPTFCSALPASAFSARVSPFGETTARGASSTARQNFLAPSIAQSIFHRMKVARVSRRAFLCGRFFLSFSSKINSLTVPSHTHVHRRVRAHMLKIYFAHLTESPPQIDRSGKTARGTKIGECSMCGRGFGRNAGLRINT